MIGFRRKMTVGINYYKMYKQGDIIVVKFPFTDGSEFKKRPALIISNETVNKTNDYLIVQITSKINADKLSIPIENTDCLKPLPLKSFVRSHKIFTVHHSLILSKITSVKPQFTMKIADEIYELISTPVKEAKKT
jgi:mRNA interferase MazF